MKFLSLRRGAITTRLMMIAVVPAAIMFVAVSATLYLLSLQDVQRDIQERGRLISASLAQSSRYSVVSGNAMETQRTLNGLLTLDNSITSIEVQNGQREVIASAGRGNGLPLLTFETPVRTEALDIDVLDNTGSRVISSNDARIAGYVRVLMSPEPALRAKRQRIYVGSAFVFLAAAMSMLVGLALAQRLRSPLAAVLNALRRIREGQYEIDIGVRAEGEIGLLQDTIVAMARGLNVKRQELEEQVAARTRELQIAVEAATQADAEKRRLIAHGNDMIEEERRRMSLEIHDGLNSSLMSVRLLAFSIAAKARNEGQDEIAQTAQKIADTTNELYENVRVIVKKLRPEVLDILGLKGAIEGLVRRCDEESSSCRFMFSADREFPVIRGSKAIALYRAVQEALANVVKHAEATRALVSLEMNGADGCLSISIRDDGKGFDASLRSGSGLGLIGMRERLSGIGGDMKFETNVGSGTKISFFLKEL